MYNWGFWSFMKCVRKELSVLKERMVISRGWMVHRNIFNVLVSEHGIKDSWLFIDPAQCSASCTDWESAVFFSTGMPELITGG